jgi:hypothetical protein
MLIEKSRDGILMDQRGGCRSNQRFAEMLGYSKEEVKKLMYGIGCRTAKKQLIEILTWTKKMPLRN